MSRSSNIRNLMLLVVAAGAVAAAGCAPHWKVVRDGGNPSPLKGAGPITVSFDYSRLIVEGKSEKDFVEAKKVEDGLRDQLGRAEEAARDQLRDRHGAAASRGRRPRAGRTTGVHAVVYPTNFTMGHYMVVASTNTAITAEVAFFANGQPVDAIGVAGEVAATNLPPDGVRARAAGRDRSRQGDREVRSVEEQVAVALSSTSGRARAPTWPNRRRERRRSRARGAGRPGADQALRATISASISIATSSPTRDAARLDRQVPVEAPVLAVDARVGADAAPRGCPTGPGSRAAAPRPRASPGA